ncbi:MAG: DUF4251 domain-containing protein [Bacteroidota bacterium]|nr:DUF4251 domain-containing protein [Bacteroidota bacterium]MDP4249710.1 DUF4251 domain-containing protein [Bacteroidota bacterium]
MNCRICVRLLMPLLLLTASVFAQTSREDKKKAKEEQRAAREALLKTVVDSRMYSFFAEIATALNGDRHELGTPYFFVRINQDSLEVDLPYWGISHAAMLGGSNDGGIRFKSVTTSYTVKTRKKGGWFISIVPKDNRFADKMDFDIEADGDATLEVTSKFRESISYRGEMTTYNASR